jgi:hypothetical protein
MDEAGEVDTEGQAYTRSYRPGQHWGVILRVMGSNRFKSESKCTFCFVLFTDRVLLYAPGWPRTCSPSVSASQVLGL